MCINYAPNLVDTRLLGLLAGSFLNDCVCPAVVALSLQMWNRVINYKYYSIFIIFP